MEGGYHCLQIRYLIEVYSVKFDLNVDCNLVAYRRKHDLMMLQKEPSN